MTQEQKNRLFEAARKMKEEKARAELEEIDDYEKLLNGGVWKVFRSFAYLSAVFALLMTIDILVPGNKAKMERYELVITDGYINVDDIWYTPPITEDGGGLQGVQSGSFSSEQSLIFQETKRVCWVSEKWRYDRDDPAEYEDRCAPSWNTIYYYFPGPSIAFMIPLMVVGFKRMSPWFTFFRFACWIVIFPCAIILAAVLLM